MQKFQLNIKFFNMKLKFDLKIIFVENPILMGVRKGEKSGAISPFIAEMQLCCGSASKLGSNYRISGNC